MIDPHNAYFLLCFITADKTKHIVDKNNIELDIKDGNGMVRWNLRLSTDAMK